MFWPLAASTFGMLGDVIGYHINKPKRPDLRYLGQIAQASRENAFQDVNAANANLGSQLGPRMNQQGLGRSSIGSSMLSRFSQGNTQSALRDLSKQRTELGLEGQRRMDEYRQAKQQNLSDLWSGVSNTAASTAAGIGATREMNANQTRLENLLREVYGTGSQVATATMPPYAGQGAGFSRFARSQNPTFQPPAYNPLDELRRRYESGEITEEEYLMELARLRGE